MNDGSSGYSGELRDAFFAAAPRYRYQRLLGEGGMGVVFAAEDLELLQAVALKVLPRVPPAEAEARLARLKREVLVSRRIKHPNVAQIYEFGMAGRFPFVSMELVPGQDLAAVISREKSLPPARLIAILRQVALGTQAAHDGGIVHRDLKPQNIMLDEQGLVAILDFGLALSREHSGLTADGTVVGTPLYMSPEQAMGGAVGPAADIYAMGVVAFHALTGSPPFEGSPMEVLLQHARREPPVERLREAGAGEELCKIVLRCMAKSPQERFESAADVERALERLGLLSMVTQEVDIVSADTRPTEIGRRSVALVVDDDPDVVRAVQGWLAEDGWITLSASDGRGALEALEEAHVDVVVMDVQMPEVDGFDTTRVIRTQPRFADLPVVLMSAKVDRHRIAFAMQAGATTLLAKPLSAEAVQRAARPFRNPTRTATR